MPSNGNRFSSLLEGNVRPCHIGTSHASLLQHYAAKSDSGKLAQIDVDTDRIYLPGDNISAVIAIQPASLEEIESIEVEFKGEVHSFGWVQSGAGSSAQLGGSNFGGSQGQIQLVKEAFFSSSARMQLPSMQSEQIEGRMVISQQNKENPLLFDVMTRLAPFLVAGEKVSQKVAMPPIFHDGTTGKPLACITYHWKMITNRKSSGRGTERIWKPIMVMSLPEFPPYHDPVLSQPLTYPPKDIFITRGIYKEVKKYVLKTAALIECELAVPPLTNWPIFRPVPVIVRLSVRAKTPSDLLEPRQFTLPSLPGASTTSNDSQEPQFYLRRYRTSHVYRSTSETARERSDCVCRWDGGHIGNGFTQQENGKGFESGREGSTPLADQRAHAGLSHGWTWPARSDPRSESIYFSTPAARFPKSPISKEMLLPGSDMTPPNEKTLQAYEYVSTCTLFAKVYLDAHPSVSVKSLQVWNDLNFAWSVEGARNKIDAMIGKVDVNLGLDAGQAATIPQSDLMKAVVAPEGLNDQSLLFHTIGDGPPSLLPPAFEETEQPPSYTGPSSASQM